jgi:invasion protein IalB
MMNINKATFPALVMAMLASGVDVVRAQVENAEPEKLTATKISKETIGAWAVQCSEVKGQQKNCNLVQIIIQAETRRSIASWVISQDKDGKVMASVTVPAGVSVPAGLTAVIGNAKPQKMEFRTCVQSSCVVQFELTSDNLKEMGVGEKAVFTAANLSDRKINIEFSLKGFTEAFETYRAEIG